MKKILRLFKPDSLFGQLLLVTLIGAALLQCVNFFAVYSIQRSYAGEFLKVGHDYVISIYQSVLSMDREQRTAFMDDIEKSRAVSDKPFRFRIMNEGPEWKTEDYYKATDMQGAVVTAIVKTGAVPLDIRARLLYEDSQEASDPKYRDYLFPLVQVIIPLDDYWLEFTQPMVLTDFSLLRRQRNLLLLGSLLISIVTVLLIRRATKPLRKLGFAAESFGRNPEMAHQLEEEGSVEVREAAQSFNSMKKRICDNLNERNNMLEAMGHDLRTPLARIQLRLDKIQPDSLREKFSANINEIQSIIEQGLELARSFHSSEHASPLDIVAFVESIVDDMRAQGEQVSLGDVPGNDAPALIVMVRPTSLKRSVENLLSNAVKYAGSARISVKQDSNAAVIDVDDDGSGIPEDMLERIFEPYYRLEYSRNRDSGGIGLGLTIARNMVLLNHGSIILINKPDGGLRARITIPHLKTPNPKNTL